MQIIRASGIAALCLLLGAIAPSYAKRDRSDERRDERQQKQEKREKQSNREVRQERQRENARPMPQQREQPSEQRARESQSQRIRDKQESPRRESVQQPIRRRPEPARAHDQGRSPEQGRMYRPPERQRHEATAWQQRRGWASPGAWRGGNSWQQGRARHWEREHISWAQRGGYGGYFIPPDRFGAHFGPRHFFRIHRRPVFYMGYPRFMYGGFSFLLLDPWPEYWQDDWYDTDDVYIDYDDGYYLYNRRQPSVRLAITVIM